MTDLLKELREKAEAALPSPSFDVTGSEEVHQFIDAIRPVTILALLDALEAAMRGLERVAQTDSGDGVDEFAECIYGARDAMRAIRKRLGGEHGG